MKRMMLVMALLAGSATAARAETRSWTMVSGGGPRLGVQVTELTDELRTFFGAQKDAGLLVGKIEAGSAAEKAGLRVGDVLVSVGGVTVDDASDVRRALGDHKEGDTVPVTVVRERKPITLAARVPKAEPMPEGFPSPGMGDMGGLDGFPRDGVRVLKLGDLDQRLEAIEKRLKELEQRK